MFWCVPKSWGRWYQDYENPRQDTLVAYTLPILEYEQFLDESSSSCLHLRRRVQLVISSQQDETQERSGPTRYLAADIASSVAEPAEEGADYGRKLFNLVPSPFSLMIRSMVPSMMATKASSASSTS
jgi:hypothetical protein